MLRLLAITLPNPIAAYLYELTSGVLWTLRGGQNSLKNHTRITWEFPKIRGPYIDPGIGGLRTLPVPKGLAPARGRAQPGASFRRAASQQAPNQALDVSCVYIHIYTFICICGKKEICTCIYTRTLIYLYMYVYVYAYVYIHACI